MFAWGKPRDIAYGEYDQRGRRDESPYTDRPDQVKCVGQTAFGAS
jgi:hypothetical protein